MELYELGGCWLACLTLASPVTAIRSSGMDEVLAEAANPRWGDRFEEASDLLWKIDLAWLLFLSFLALAVVCYRPVEIVGADPRPGERKWRPTPWYRTLFASLSSHAAGIIGFVGFQKTVVARIVSNSQPQGSWSMADFLLETSAAISVLAIFASLVFLVVDYLRRLAMDSAESRGLRLLLQPGKLERTGLGIVLMILTGILLSLYLSVIAVEYAEDRAKEEPTVDLKLLLERVFGCATVLLYFLNLRGLAESPKVQAHTTGSKEETCDLKDFLQQCSGQGDDVQSDGLRQRLADFAGYAAGEDLSLFIRSGSRRAFFQTQRWAPVLHVVCGLLLLGTLPCMCHFLAERLFDKPELVDVKPLSSTLVPRFRLGSRRDRYVLLLSTESSGLQVLPNFEQTSSVSICCDPAMAVCTEQSFKHSLVKVDTQPAVLKIPGNSTRCTLTLLGHSSRAKTQVDLEVVVASQHHLCDCAEAGCRCCRGYRGRLEATSDDAVNVSGACAPARCKIANSNGQDGSGCACADGFLSTVYWTGKGFAGSCTPATCEIPNSTGEPGLRCRCRDKFHGEILWEGATASGKCLPAACDDVANSNNQPGDDCGCADGYTGAVTWGSRASFEGNCTPAPCNIANSSMTPGHSCKCKDGFQGKISWQGATPVGRCNPFPCDVRNSNMVPGSACRCRDGFSGTIYWGGESFQGSCVPAPCNVSNSNKQSGWSCQCLDSFAGNISWQASVPQGSCLPAPCDVPNSTLTAGSSCRCKDFYEGQVTWKGPVAVGSCSPVPCPLYSEADDKQGQGHSCKCIAGFDGNLTWKGSQVQGFCMPAPCSIAGSFGPGLSCKCMNAFQGLITWQGPVASGACTPAPCNVRNSNKKPGYQCECLDGYGGTIWWRGSEHFGQCEALMCRGKFSNDIHGPGCGCDNGYTGTRRIAEYFKYGPDEDPIDVFEVDCEPAPCLIENSTESPGVHCNCKDGFAGDVTWNGPTALGQCVPAECSVENSNFLPGLACDCKPGFVGSVHWLGHRSAGSCEVMPCDVPNSDYAGGPECQCKEGFFGIISLEGRRILSSGVCSPLPTCSAEIVYATSLGADIKDSQNVTCLAGQALLARGVLCDATTGAIRWSSLRATGPGRCGWELSEHGQGCGAPIDLGPKNRLHLPTKCVEEPPRPHCSSRIIYAVTSRQASRYGCGDGSAPDDQAVYFTGRRCGYDLIKWEAANISQPSPCTHVLSGGCGEGVEGELLPNVCLHFSEPASLSLGHINLKLFDDGSFLLDPSEPGVTTWQSDGRYLSLRRKSATEERFWGFKAMKLDGSRFLAVDNTPMWARWPPPAWWSFRFRRADTESFESNAQFDADRLSGCQKSFFSHSDGSCYRVSFGQEIWSTKDDSVCALQDFRNLTGTRHAYVVSTFGIQTYRSAVPCFPVAAYRELQLEVANVDIDEKDASYSVTHAPCRTTIRMAMNAGLMEVGCQSVYRAIYSDMRNSPAHELLLADLDL